MGVSFISEGILGVVWGGGGVRGVFLAAVFVVVLVFELLGRCVLAQVFLGARFVFALCVYLVGFLLCSLVLG